MTAATQAGSKTKQEQVFERYGELEREHPEWSRDQILDRIVQETGRSKVSVQTNYYRGRRAQEASGGKASRATSRTGAKTPTKPKKKPSSGGRSRSRSRAGGAQAASPARGRRPRAASPAAQVEDAARVISTFASDYGRMREELDELRAKVARMEAALS